VSTGRPNCHSFTTIIVIKIIARSASHLQNLSKLQIPLVTVQSFQVLDATAIFTHFRTNPLHPLLGFPKSLSPLGLYRYSNLYCADHSGRAV
jgi:hypothetical protein